MIPSSVLVTELYKHAAPEDKMQHSLWSLISFVPVSQHSSINTFANLSGLLSKMKTLADFWLLLEKMFQRKKLILYTCKFLTS